VIVMSNAITALVSIALILLAGLTFSTSAFNSVDYAAQSWKQMEQTSEEAARTDINIVDAQNSGTIVDVLVQNAGIIHITRFSAWDVVVHFYDTNDEYHISRLVYSDATSPGTNEWSVSGIYTSDNLSRVEVFEPRILNPGEVAQLKLGLSTTPGSGTVNWVILSTANGVTASKQFDG
jgi:hypothetical protein